MSHEQKDFCFCTLALRNKYRLLAQQLASDLEKYSPGTILLVLTDEPSCFQENSNVLAFKHRQQGILHCYNDKSILMEVALSKFPAAIHIDADTRILAPLPDNLQWKPGITAGHYENLVEHANKYNPERLPPLQKVAVNLNIELETVTYMGESLFVITRDNGREVDYLKCWAMIGRYLELRGIHAGEGNAMGIAATKVGWTISSDGWQEIKDVVHHIDASLINNQVSLWGKLQKRIGYHYRLNLARVMALKNANFYYK
ncbi:MULTISPECIES: hypothetical protein [unclassified Nodularia (in: cyanobacteria)]|uniref:hypothetical protein n=1 Tax=unclassified Nodularia (in: cyanobacteria) TaxID=2656917 RepID=UPI0018805440|nr:MULTISPECIES: hypothetical protein [unclassified Nodularia (in: cyanobacteria)]MBE9197620.1 hypothetical protein [Nodularia sp. LEGE 06071]MCC2692126.1 hypothetical protein [Nodularia sp. LEGE 04288]